MPLQSVVSYLPVLEKFISHWEAVQEESGKTIAFQGGSLALAKSLRDKLRLQVDTVHSEALDVILLRSKVSNGREEVKSLLEQFRAVVRAYWDGTPWPALLPRLPKSGALLDKFLRPSRDALSLWKILEGEPLPPGAPDPILIGPEKDLGRAGFAAKVEEVRLLGLELEEAEFSLSAKRALRNATMAEVRALLSGYMRALAAEFSPDDPLLLSAPRLWPLPGHTPEPVEAEGGWIEAAGRAEVSWEKSPEKTISHYQLRGCAGGDFDAGDERVVANIPPDAPLRWEGTDLLSKPGAQACFRVYVILKTGNERASNTVVVTRPAG